MVLKDTIEKKLKEVIDPELGINIVDLGLVYDIDIGSEGKVRIVMTLTTPGCPLAGVLEQMVRGALDNLEGVKDISVGITFEPPWTQEMMSEEAKALLGF